MTGQEASEGQDMENAIKLAIANLNATGGVLGKTITTDPQFIGIERHALRTAGDLSYGDQRRVELEGTAQDLSRDEAVVRAYLGGAHV